MMKKSNSISINILSVFLILTCLLLALVGPTNAWFTDEHRNGIYINVTVSNLKIKLYQHISGEDVEIYTYDKNEENAADNDDSTGLQFVEVDGRINPDENVNLQLKLKNEDEGETSVYIRFRFQLLVRGVSEDVEIPIEILGMTVATASTPGFIKGNDDYYYYKESSLEGAKNTKFVKGAGVDESIYILQGFKVPYSSFFKDDGTMLIKNSETVYIRLTLDESAFEDFRTGG